MRLLLHTGVALWLALAACGGCMAADGVVVDLDEPTRQRCLAVLREGIDSAEFWPAVHAAEGLTLGGHAAEVRARFGPRLERETDDQRRCGLARELVRAGEGDRLAMLLAILTAADPHGHVHAAECLFKLGDIGDGVGLRDHLKRTEDPRLRLMAAAALARVGDQAALRQLRDMLQDGDPEVGRLAAWALGKAGSAADIAPLHDRLVRATDESTRAFVQHALAELGDPRGLDAVARNLDSADPQVRAAAALCAGEARVPGAAGRLTGMLADPSLDARVRAAQALLMLGAGRGDHSIRGEKPHPIPGA